MENGRRELTTASSTPIPATAAIALTVRIAGGISDAEYSASHQNLINGPVRSCSYFASSQGSPPSTESRMSARLPRRRMLWLVFLGIDT